ncbi:hypothetical protein SI65_03209 [Aspergillus cristatus]|uniref:Uncharacterized protein n=1 Tax=Aspergillus cristatus TaxID=573508 RepID=A0A1E3BN14_ASPCR|nr:hypothetical protein SI65_03209 [Aspergillus cristatus]
MFEDMGPMTGDYSRHCSLPSVRSLSSSNGAGAVDMSEDRRLPPLPRVEPLPRGPFNPFNARTLAPSPPTSHDAFPVKSSWPTPETMMAPPSPANSQDSTWQDSFASQKTMEWPSYLSQNEIVTLIAPRNINRKPPLQQLCGRKRKGSMISADPDDQREKHRIAEGNRRKNLSQLHRELDSRIHDFFLERAGWNPGKSLPQSKEHIVQGAIYLIDFMLLIIVHLIRQENEMPQHLSEKLQPQVRCMQLQQLVSSLQQQNQSVQAQLKTVKHEKQLLEERNQALEYQLKAYENVFRVPKSETNSPQILAPHPDTTANTNKPKNLLPGLRVFCDEIAAGSPEASRFDGIPISGPPSFGGHSFMSSTPPTTGPSSPVHSYSVPTS